MLKVGREDDGLVSCFTWQLNTQIPRFERDKSELEVVSDQMFLGKLVEAVDSVTEGACVLDVLPGEGCQTGWGESVL
jgi:hypothetical protein